MNKGYIITVFLHTDVYKLIFKVWIIWSVSKFFLNVCWKREVDSHATYVMMRGLGHRRSGMLKSFFVKHILQTFLKYIF